MLELYSFLFCSGLGIISRLMYLGASALARRTDFFPVTVLLDIFLALAVGGAFIAYTVLTAASLAPYMFVALAAGYAITYKITACKIRRA